MTTTPTAAPPTGAALAELVEVMRRLLAPDGCPWDREQTLATLEPYLLEETYELLEAMRAGPREHAEELGDVMFQLVFQAAIRQRAGEFDIDDVCRGIAAKLTRRHPHVFGDAKVSGSAQVLENWDALKKKEKAGRRTLDGVPVTLPALARAQKLTERASMVGFDWPDAVGPRGKVDEELREADLAMAAGDHAATEAELGDLLFAVVNLARKVGVHAESTPPGSTPRFRARLPAGTKTARLAQGEDRHMARKPSGPDADAAQSDLLTGAEKAAVQDVENRFMRKITVVPRKEYHYEQFDLAGK